MSLPIQIIFGTLLLVLCSTLHIALLVWAIKLLQKMGVRFEIPHKAHHWGMMIAAAFGVVVFAHTAQVWSWALAFVAMEALPNISDAIYFALVTYTTLGYGDLTVADGFRVFAAMAAVTGLLNFGLSTAFLVGLFAKILPIDEDR